MDNREIQDLLTTRQRACFMAIRSIAAANPGSKVIPEDPDSIVEMIEVWDAVLDMPDEWILPATREAIRRRRGFPASVGDVQDAYETLASQGAPDASTAVEWVYEAMNLLSELRWDMDLTDDGRRGRVRTLMLEKLRESRLSDDYVDSLTSFAMHWAPQIADSPPRGHDGSSTFRAQVRDALKGSILATTSWRRAKGLNPAEVTARMLGDGQREIGGGA